MIQIDVFYIILHANSGSVFVKPLHMEKSFSWNFWIHPANIVLMKTSWRRLSSFSSEGVFKTSSRRLDQDKYIYLNHTSSEDAFKTSLRRLDQD